MKFAADRPYADSVAAARKLVEIANSIEAVQDGRIYIQLVNCRSFSEHKGSPRNQHELGRARRKIGHHVSAGSEIRKGSESRERGPLVRDL
jgi:hypothetical protein